MGSSHHQPVVLQLLPAGPHVLRTLPKKTARPNPQEYLRKGSSSPVRNYAHASTCRLNKWPTNKCAESRPCFTTDKTRFAERLKACPETQFQELYDLGLINFVSVRWQCHDMVLIWRSPMSLKALKFYLPVFIAGAANDKEPYHFLAMRGALDMVRALGSELADAAQPVAASLRQLLLRQCPARCADACLLLSHVCQEAPGGAQALQPHFRLLGPGLNRFARCRRACAFGSRAVLPLCDCVAHVLRQLEECGGRSMHAVLLRHVPLYEGPVKMECRGWKQQTC